MERQLEEALKVLGIPADSDRERVTNAYRRLARVTHPDVSPDPDAAERFATVTAAYHLVSGVVDASAAATAFGLAWRPRGRRASPTSDPARSCLLLAVTPYLPAESWGRPPIAAGPVMVRRAQGTAGVGDDA